MSTLKYDVIFEGKIRDGFDAAGVKGNIARLFKISEEKAEQILSRPRVVLKAGVDRQTAGKYLELMARAGAVITIEKQASEDPIAGSDSSAAPAEPGTPAEPAAPAVGEIKNVGPIWGRKFEGGPAGPAPVTGPGTAARDPGHGSLERGIAGDYPFAIRDVLSEAWRKVSGNKGTIALAYLIYFAIMMGVSLGAALIRGVLTAVAGSAGTIVGEILALVLQIAVTTPLMAGLFMLGVRISVDAPAKAGSVLAYYDRIRPLLLTLVLMYVMIILGYLLLVLPGIYLSVAYCLAIFLVVDKRLSPWQALEASRKAVTHRWFAVFGLFLLIGLLSVLGAIPLFIGLIWIVPLGLIAWGILYRNIFGVSSIAADS
jgi:hypothetical protein